MKFCFVLFRFVLIYQLTSVFERIILGAKVRHNSWVYQEKCEYRPALNWDSGVRDKPALLWCQLRSPEESLRKCVWTSGGSAFFLCWYLVFLCIVSGGGILHLFRAVSLDPDLQRSKKHSPCLPCGLFYLRFWCKDTSAQGRAVWFWTRYQKIQFSFSPSSLESGIDRCLRADQRSDWGSRIFWDL